MEMAHFNCSELLRKCKNSLLERIPQKVLASVAVIFLLAATLLAKDAPPWPLKIEISPSSSFGEFRGMRFHTGVDLRTNQKTGYPVYAIEDGFVSRMKVQHRGFGYALYVDHPSINSRAVFGHLEDYAEPMATYIREKLKKMRAHFGIDDFFQESKFPIKKGQIIAYTGESGLGPPHLHFELRKFNDELIAPTSLGMIIPDKRPPDLLDIYFEPLATDSRINDQFLPQKFSLKKSGKNAYTWDGPVYIRGRVGVLTGLVDCGEGGNVFGVQFIKISLDGKELLHRKFDNFSYDQNHECPYVYDYHKSNPRGTGYVYNLFKWPFETLPISAEFGSWAGVIGEQSPGLHHLEILCEDFGGNKVVANGEVYLEPQKKLAKPFTGNISCKKVEFNTFSVVAIGEISQNLGKADFDGVSCRDGNGVEHVLPAKISGRNVQVAFPIAEIWKDGAMSGPNAGERCPSQVLPKLAFVPSAGGELKENSVGVTAVFPKGSLHFPILGQILPVHGIQGTKKLPAKSAGYAIQPSNFVTGKALKLEIPFASHSKPQRLGIYAGVSPNFSYQGGEVHDSKLVLECRALKKGAFVIMEDNIPPVLQFKGSRTIKHLGPVWVFSVSDLGEGISDEKFLPVVDGKTADWDFDPDHDELYIVKPVGKSGHSVTISAFDQAGNKAVFTRKL